jgi:hypothetical protein
VSFVPLLRGLDFQVTEILGRAGGDSDVDEQVAGSLEAGPGRRAIFEAGDQALDQESAVVADPDAVVSIGAGDDVVSLGMLVFRAVSADDEHPLAGSPLVVDDPAGHRAPGL